MNALAIAESRLLAPAGLDTDALQRAFASLLGPGIDFGDLYFQHSRRESWSMEDGIVKDGAHAIEQGVGVRAISGEKTGFAYSDDLDAAALIASAQSARAIARDGRQHAGQALARSGGRQLYPALDPVDAFANEAKVALLRRVDALVRTLDPRVQQVMVSLSGGVDTVLVARSDGVLAGDVRPLVRMNIQVIVEQNGRRESGFAGFGGRYSYAHLLADDKPETFAREALRQALVNLDAIDAPAGTMPVVLGHGWPGVLLHEAVGHGLEGDFNRKGTSTYAGRIGQRVAAKGVTIVDDGTLDGRRGLAQHRRRRHADVMHDADRGRHPGRLHAGHAQCAADGHGADRQWSPRILRAPDHAAHDQHLHACRHARSRGDDPLGQARPVRGEFRRWPGRHHQRQVRVHRHRGLPDRGRQGHRAGEGRDADRQRPRDDAAGEDDRQRHGAGRWRRHLRQGRAVGAGRAWASRRC
jgi:hypothetical protein